MSNEITVRVGLPSVIAGSAKELRIDIARDPEGDFLATESFTVEPDTERLVMKANAGTHCTVGVRAIDDAGQSSKPVIKRFQANDPICPELANDMTVEVITEGADIDEEPPAEPSGDGDPPVE